MSSQTLWKPFGILFIFLLEPLLAGISNPVEVNLRETAVLSCTSTCYGEISWRFKPDKSGDDANLEVLKCVQGKCTEGDGYKKRASLEKIKLGNMSLTIHPVVYNDEGWYGAHCDSKVVCFVHLDVLVPTAVNASVRDNITLPCYAHTEKQIDDNNVNIIWKRDNQVVVEVKNGTTHYGSGFNERASVPINSYSDGDLSLSISEVTPSDNGIYRCYYKTDKLGEPRAVTLTVKAYIVTHEKKVGDDLMLDMFSLDQVTITFNSSEGAQMMICSVARNKFTDPKYDPKCDPKYSHRVSVVNDSLVLSGLSFTDSGTFTVKDNVGSVLSVCTVTVKGVAERHRWMVVFSPILFVFVGIGLLILCLCHRKLQKRQGHVYFNNQQCTVDLDTGSLVPQADVGLSQEETRHGTFEQSGVPHTPVEETSPQTVMTTGKQDISIDGFD